MTARANDKDAIESRALSYHEAVHKAFLEIARANPQRCAVLDASMAPEALADAAMETIGERLAGFADGSRGRTSLGRSLAITAAKQEFLAAVASGKLHHGWLLRGPRGVGKARLALQFAMHLLGNGDGRACRRMRETPVGRLVVAGSHPDLRIIRRPIDDKGKQKSEIPVDSVRELSEFFSMRPRHGRMARGDHRRRRRDEPLRRQRRAEDA